MAKVGKKTQEVILKQVARTSKSDCSSSEMRKNALLFYSNYSQVEVSEWLSTCVQILLNEWSKPYGAFELCWKDCIYELNAHEYRHKVMSGKLRIFFKPWVSDVGSILIVDLLKWMKIYLVLHSQWNYLSQNTSMLYNYNLQHLHKLNKNKNQWKNPQCSFFMHHFVDVELKNLVEFYVEKVHYYLASTKVIWKHLIKS